MDVCVVESSMKSVTKESIVVRSHSFIEAIIRSLTTTEFRIIIHLTASIEIKQTPEQFATTWFSLSVKEYCEVCDLPLGGSQYRSLKSAMEKLFKRIFKFPTKNGWDQVGGWITNYKYNKELGLIQVMFNPEIKPYMFELEHYTKYKIGDFAKLKSIYSLRLYEMILKWGRIKRRVDDLESLRSKLCNDNTYSSLVSFRVKVIAPAIHEINNKTDFEIKVSYEKEGRQYVRVIFDIIKSPIVQERQILNDQDVEFFIYMQECHGITLCNPGESKSASYKRLKREKRNEILKHKQTYADYA